MAGGDAVPDVELKGYQKIFNTVTPRGRLHVAYASIAFWTTLFVTIKLWPSKNKAIEAPKNAH